MEFDLKIINRVSIFHDSHELFIINRVRVSRSGRHLLPKLKSSTLPGDITTRVFLINKLSCPSVYNELFSDTLILPQCQAHTSLLVGSPVNLIERVIFWEFLLFD